MYTIIVYCDRQGEIVDGEIKAWDDEEEDDAYAYLFAAREEVGFADGAVVDRLPCFDCHWWDSGCTNREAPSFHQEASRWGGLPGCDKHSGINEFFCCPRCGNTGNIEQSDFDFEFGMTIFRCPCGFEGTADHFMNGDPVVLAQATVGEGE